MEVFIITENGIPKPDVFTGLRAACEYSGINYNTASRGKREFIIDNKFFRITKASVTKISGRGKNAKL